MFLLFCAKQDLFGGLGVEVQLQEIQSEKENCNESIVWKAVIECFKVGHGTKEG